MNNVLAGVFDKCVAKFNDYVVNGMATESIKQAPDYLDAIIRSSMRSASPKLEYHGWRKITPHEEYESLTSRDNGRVSYDIAVSDLYKIELLFSYNGAMLPKRHLYVPYLDDGGLMKISDTLYHIAPVLSDTVVSPTERDVFIRLLRDKLIFKRVNRNILCNGEKISGQIITSTIYRTSNRNNADNLGSIVPPVALYLLTEYGMRDAFLKYSGVDVKITNEVDVSAYANNYNIYSSTKSKPRSLKVNVYRGHDVKVLVPKGSETPFVLNMVAGLIYTLDANFEKAAEMADAVNFGDVSQEKEYWKLLLGNIIFKNNYTADRIKADMDDHFIALRSYIDSLIKLKLAEIDINVNDFFDLLAVVLSKYSDWLLNSKSYNNNIFNRYIDVLYYILYDIILGINKTIFELTRKSATKDLNSKEISRIFNSQLSPKRIFQIIKSSATNITLYMVDSSSDNKYHKVTSVLELQERGKNVTKSKSSVFPSATRTITGSDLFMGSMLFLGKKAPTPKLKINPFITVDERTGRPTPSKAKMETITILDSMFNGRIEDNSILNNAEFEIDIDEINDIDK